MNNVDKKNNYLTYEKVIDMTMSRDYEDAVNLIPSKLDDRNFNYDDLMNMSIENSQDFIKDIIQLHPDYSGIVLDFANLVDTNEKYVIIDRLLAIINSDFHYCNNNDDKIVDRKTICGLLNKTLKIFKSIKSNTAVIKSLIEEHKEKSYDLMSMFLNEKILYEYLLENKEFMKQAKVYNEVFNLFPLINDNGR